MRSAKNRILRVAKVVLPVILILFIFYQGQNELRNLSLQKSIQAIQHVPSWQFALLVVSGLLAVATMYFYDVLLLRSLKADVPRDRIFRTSWIANSFNGIIGFGGLAFAYILIGAGLRKTQVHARWLFAVGHILAGAALFILPFDYLTNSEKWQSTPALIALGILRQWAVEQSNRLDPRSETATPNVGQARARDRAQTRAGRHSSLPPCRTSGSARARARDSAPAQ